MFTNLLIIVAFIILLSLNWYIGRAIYRALKIFADSEKKINKVHTESLVNLNLQMNDIIVCMNNIITHTSEIINSIRNLDR